MSTTNGTLSPSGTYVSNNDELTRDSDYEVQMEHRFGIGSHCGSEELNMHTAYLEPGASTRTHYHMFSDAGMFVTEGECTMVTWDKEDHAEERVCKVGDFIYVPRGVRHKAINKSDSVRFGLVAAYNGAGTGEATGKYYTEPLQ